MLLSATLMCSRRESRDKVHLAAAWTRLSYLGVPAVHMVRVEKAAQRRACSEPELSLEAQHSGAWPWGRC